MGTLEDFTTEDLKVDLNAQLSIRDLIDSSAFDFEMDVFAFLPDVLSALVGSDLQIANGRSLIHSGHLLLERHCPLGPSSTSRLSGRFLSEAAHQMAGLEKQ